MRPLFSALLLSALVSGLLGAQQPRRTVTLPNARSSAGQPSVSARADADPLHVRMEPGSLTRRPNRIELVKLITILYPLGPFEAELGVTAHLTPSAPVAGGKTGVTTTSAWQHIRLFDPSHYSQDDHWLLHWPQQVYSGGTVSVHFKAGTLKTPTLVNCLVAPEKNFATKLKVVSMGDDTPLGLSEVTVGSPQQVAVLLMPTEGWQRVTLENLTVGNRALVYYCDVTPVK